MTGDSRLNKFLVETISYTILADEDYKDQLPVSSDLVKELAEEELACETGDNVLLVIGQFLRSMPMSWPASAVDAACKDAWESIDWKALTEEVNKEIVRLM